MTMLGFSPSPTLYSPHTSVAHTKDLDILQTGCADGRTAFQAESYTFLGAALLDY